MIRSLSIELVCRQNRDQLQPGSVTEVQRISRMGFVANRLRRRDRKKVKQNAYFLIEVAVDRRHGRLAGFVNELLDLLVDAGPLRSAMLEKRLYAFTEIFGRALLRIDLDGFLQFLIQPPARVL